MSKKKGKGICSTPFCRNVAQVSCLGKPTLHCSKCYKRQWRAKNPELDAYFNLANSARRRKIPFLLTKQQWHNFCEKTKYLEGKGKSAISLSVDRIESDKGYSFDNIRILTIHWNSRRNFVQYFAEQDQVRPLGFVDAPF